MIVYTAPEQAAADIPIISYARAFSADPADRRQVAAEIGAACRHTGFFYLVDHGVSGSLIERQFAAARAFFALPLAAKMALAVPAERGRRGYEPMAAQSLDKGSPADLKEAILLGADATAWPPVPGFAACQAAYRDAIIALGRAVAGSLALSLQLDEDYFAEALARPNCTVRLLRYPPQQASAKANQLGSGAHTDWGFLTLLAQDGVGGLEVQTVEGRWIRADPVPGAFIVNLGDMVPHLTGGLFRSNYHRVLNGGSSADRYSIASFFNPAPEVSFDRVPTCREADWQPAPRTVEEHVRARIAETYAAT